MTSETHREILLTGLPRWLVEDYLASLGATLQRGEWVHPEGWRAQVEPAPDYQIGSLRVGQVRLRLHGSPQAVQAAWKALEPKLLRAGG